jgi:hypothetical protein
MLTRMSIADWPNMKKASREKLHKKLYKQAYPSTFKEKKQVSLEELATILKG